MGVGVLDLAVSDENLEIAQPLHNRRVGFMHVHPSPFRNLVGETTIIIHRREWFEAVLGADNEVLCAVTGSGVDQTRALLEGHVGCEDEEAFTAGERVAVMAALEDAAIEYLHGFLVDPTGGCCSRFQKFGGDDPEL